MTNNTIMMVVGDGRNGHTGRAVVKNGSLVWCASEGSLRGTAVDMALVSKVRPYTTEDAERALRGATPLSARN